MRNNSPLLFLLLLLPLSPFAPSLNSPAAGCISGKPSVFPLQDLLQEVVHRSYALGTVLQTALCCVQCESIRAHWASDFVSSRIISSWVLSSPSLISPLVTIFSLNPFLYGRM